MKALFAVILLCFSSLSFGQNWEEIRNDDGIKVLKQEVPDSNLIAVRGEALVDATPAEIVWVLMDHKFKSDWVDKLYVSKELKSESELVTIQYAAFKMPAIVSNRDFVYRYEIGFGKKNNAVVLDITSTVADNAPETVGVRGHLHKSRYSLVPNGKQTHVTVEVHVDPKGWLPSWLVNLLQKKWPYKTLMGLRTQVKKDFVKEHKATKREMIRNGIK